MTNQSLITHKDIPPLFFGRLIHKPTTISYRLLWHYSDNFAPRTVQFSIVVKLATEGTYIFYGVMRTHHRGQRQHGHFYFQCRGNLCKCRDISNIVHLYIVEFILKLWHKPVKSSIAATPPDNNEAGLRDNY